MNSTLQKLFTSWHRQLECFETVSISNGSCGSIWNGTLRPSTEHEVLQYLSCDKLLGDDGGAARVVDTHLHLPGHLAPDAGVAPHHTAAVITARPLDAVAISDGLAQAAGDGKAGKGVQHRHATAPAMLGRCLALQAGETPQGTATGAYVGATVTHSGAPCPSALGGGHTGDLLLDGHDYFLGLKKTDEVHDCVQHTSF